MCSPTAAYIVINLFVAVLCRYPSSPSPKPNPTPEPVTSNPTAYIIMNLFVAILLNAFADSSEDEDEGAPDNASDASTSPSRVDDKSSQSPSSDGATPTLLSPPSLTLPSLTLPSLTLPSLTLPSLKEGSVYERLAEDDECSPPPPPPPPQWPVDHSLCCFGPSSGIRKCCKWLVGHALFDRIIVVAIIASSVCLALDSPRVDPASTLAFVLKQFNYVWTCLFFCELMVKVRAGSNSSRGSHSPPSGLGGGLAPGVCCTVCCMAVHPMRSALAPPICPRPPAPPPAPPPASSPAPSAADASKTGGCWLASLSRGSVSHVSSAMFRRAMFRRAPSFVVVGHGSLAKAAPLSLFRCAPLDVPIGSDS